jgi:hypothetical protein
MVYLGDEKPIGSQKIRIGRLSFIPSGCDLTGPLFTANFPLLGAKRGSVGDKQLVR